MRRMISRLRSAFPIPEPLPRRALTVPSKNALPRQTRSSKIQRMNENKNTTSIPPGTRVLVTGATGFTGSVLTRKLAAAGLKVRVVERRGVVGGAAVTEEFHPGFRNSTASYTVSLLHPQVIRDLKLVERGLRIVERPFSNFVPLPDGRSLKFGGDLAATQAEVAKFSARDAQRLPAYYAQLDRLADLEGVAI